MFRTKKDVERHVADVLSKIDNENEKNLRGYTFARLYFQVKDYESAKKYLSGFLSIRDHHAASHKLMGQIYEATNNPENALHSYKRSLEIDPHQSDIILKICELYCQLPVDHETARYWADRAEQLYPHHETVFKLREYLVSAEGEPDRQELENLIATELAAQPKNIDLRIKLLRLYLDTERVKEAYEHATMIESKRLFPHSVDWYYLLGDIFEAYQEEFGDDLDSQFYIHYLTALDHLIFLTLAEPHTFSLENGRKPSSLNDAAAVLLTFDQMLKKAVEKDIKEGSWTYFIHHLKGQLYFHMTSLLMKRAKMDQGNRKEAFRFSAGLAVVCYTFKPINLLQEVWFSQMEDNQKTFTNFFQQGALRMSFIGHVLLSLCKEDKSSWLQKLKTEVCIPQVKERIYSRLITSLFQKEKLSLSFFISDSTFEQSSLELPTEIVLTEYDKSAYKLCPSSLHHLVWLELQRENVTVSSHDNIIEIFKSLQYSNKNLSKGSCESLCILDLEAYLCAAVYQSKFLIERKSSVLNARNESVLTYPPDIADALCSKVQAVWWKAAHGLYTCAIKEKLGEHRRSLQHGLEVIRGIGNHGMEVQLVIHLARAFSDKASALDKNAENKTDKNKNKLTSDNVVALYLRATHYWNIALGILEKLASGQTLNVSKDPMFVGSGKVLSKSEVKSHQEEGQLFLAVRLMESDKLNEAAELLSKISSPYGSYYLALTLKKLASQEERYSNTRVALLNKSKSALHETMDRIKDDKSHPLNKELYIELEDVENDLGHELSIGNENNCEDADETDTYDGSSIFNISYSWQDNDRTSVHSTPRPSAKFMTSKRAVKSVSHESPSQHFEPSPERLDAQIRALALNQDESLKSFLQQQQTLLETNKSIVDALKQIKDVVEQIKKQFEELSLSDGKLHSKTVPKKPGYLKGHGEEEEDYYDPNAMLDYYEDGEDYRASGYSYERPSRMVHDPPPGASAPLNYVVSPALPPGPPPPLNHYNYQYPHHVLPTPPPAVPERPPYYHPPGQGLPFSEGQQLPQFHFHVATSVVKPPPPPSLTTSLPHVVSGLPPVSVPPPSVVLPPPGAAPLPAPTPWSKTAGVPHAFQIPLPPSTIFVSAASHVVPTSSQITPPTLPAVTSSHSQLKDLLQTPVSKTITFGQPLTTTSPAAVNTTPSIFSGLSKTPDTPKDHSRCDSETAASPDIDGHDLEREVMGDFKPLIPLPAEIVVETGEENEVVLFEDRAKLYRFVDQEWKERGIGFVKILYHEGSDRVRLLMRRDQVLKVCANHYILPNMEIHALKNSDRAWTWVAQDFADEELRPEQFCIRFKTPEIAASFKSAFDKAVNIAKETDAKKLASPKVTSTVTASPLTQKPFGGKFLPKAGSWTCPTCYVSNAADKLLCVACETKKPGSQASSLTTGSWTCPTCYVINAADKLLCVACETKKPGSQASSLTTESTVITTSLSSDSKSPFQAPTSSTFTFGLPVTTCSSDKFISNAAKSVIGGFTFSSSPVIQETETPDIKEREILVVSTKSKDGPQVTKVSPPKTSPFTGFTFKSPTVTTTASSTQVTSVLKSGPFTGFTFQTSKTTIGMSNASTPPSFVPSSNVVTTTVANISISDIQSAMQNISPTFVFSKTSAEKDVSSKGETKSSSTKSNAAGSLFVHVSPEGRRVSTEGTENTPEEFVPTAEFKPVVPLPALVDVKTGEEEEEKMFGERAKLFRFDSDTKEWKERGIGEIKILYLKNSHKYRIIMRREQVLKVCANHYILPGMKLTPLSNSDRAWIWIAQDYSDGEVSQVKLAAKFKNPDIAQQFFSVFQKCQKELSFTEEKESGEAPNPCVGNKSAFDQLFKPSTNSWNCSKCLKSNMNSSSCVYCQTPRTSSTTPVSAVTSTDQKTLSDTWECKSCYIKNASSDSKCIACSSPKSISESSISLKDSSDHIKNHPFGNNKTDSTPLSELFKPQPGSWECEACLVRNKADSTKCASCETLKPGSSAPSTNFGKFNFSSSTPTTSTNSASNFSFGGAKSGGEFVFGMKPATQPTTFTFGLSGLSNKPSETIGFKPALSTNSNTPAVFGGTSQSTTIFGGTPQNTPIFGGAALKTETSQSTSTSVFGGSALKADTSQCLFGMAQKSESSPAISSIFGGSSQKTDTTQNSSIFGGTTQKSELSMSASSIFGGLSEKTETPKTVQKTETTQSSPVPTSTSSQSVFSFGSSNQANSSSGTVEFRFGSPQKYEFNFSGVRPRSPTKTPKSPRSPATPSDVEDEEENESFDADSIYFQPVIPLPPKVDIKTGEENEKTIFCKRAKLFRFCSGEWKERGIGDIKILYDEVGKKVRLLMRRDQVLKVCLNHYLTKDIVFEKRGDKTLSWAATDFSENEAVPELFALRFKTSEFTDEFKSAVENALKLLEKPSSTVDISKAASSFSFKSDTNSKTDSSFAAGSLSSRFGTSAVFGSVPSTNETTSFSFSFSDKPTSSTFFKQVSSNQNVPSDKGFKFGTTSEPKEASQIDDEIQVIYEAKASPEEIDQAQKLQLPPTFYLFKNKPPCPGCIGCKDYIPPAKSTGNENIEIKASDKVEKEKEPSQAFESNLFGAKSSLSFADLALKSGFEASTPSSTKKVFEGAGTPVFANLNNSAEGDADDETVTEGPDIHFEPVIPLPELVTVKTGEEDETPIFVNRAKLFRFDIAKKEWKERGVGDLKILKHNDKLRFRIILRRDQVHKIACNHCIEEKMELSPLSTSDSALCWNALDYSESQPEASQFAVRFKNKDLLEQFRQKFNECKELLKKGSGGSSCEVHATSAISQKETTIQDSQERVEYNESSAESQNDHESSGSETNEDEEDSDNDSILYEKRVSFEISEGNDNEFKSAGSGSLKVMYDDTVFGYHVYMNTDNGDCVCDHIIAIQTVLRTEKKRATWAAIDLSVDPPRRRKFRATFNSKEALDEFNIHFEEGKEAAVSSEIVEKTDYLFSPSGHQT